MFSLKEMFDKEVIVSLDLSYASHWPGGNKSEEDKLWCYEIKGKRGVIYPQSENTACLQVEPKTGRRLLKLYKDKAVFKRESDIEFELIIPLNLIRSSFRYIKPRSRRGNPR